VCGPQFAEECLAKIDHDGNGVISEQEFVNALKKDPLLMQCFSRSMLSGVPIEEAKASWQQLESSGAKKFDLSLLQVRVCPLCSLGDGTHSMVLSNTPCYTVLVATVRSQPQPRDEQEAVSAIHDGGVQVPP